MSVEPISSEFEKVYAKGKPQVVWNTLIADLETPVSVMLKLANNKPNSFLLESVEGGSVRGRYSIIGMDPDIIWRCHGNKAEIKYVTQNTKGKFKICRSNTIESLKELVKNSQIDLPESMPPMAAGLVGYLGYDTVTLMENIPSTRTDPLKLPDGLFIRPTIMAIFDLVKDTVIIVTPVRPEKDISAKRAYNSAKKRLENILYDFNRKLVHKGPMKSELKLTKNPISNTTPSTFKKMVRKAKEYIFAGDIFQVVLSQRFTIPFHLPAFALYRALRRTNPSPFLFFLNFGDFSIVGSSPEILIRLRDGKLTLRPLAGTRPRGANATEDQTLEKELLKDEKELAEHMMLLDLGRNDIGRVAKIGTVSVTEKMLIEKYSHVMHIVSNIEAQIDKKYDAVNALVAAFPAGTVSGAPKIRAMEIIHELEIEKRGVYSGVVGYFSANGSMDTCIVLRTALVKDEKVYIQSGAGIVADSDPEKEQQECKNKALAIVKAVEEAIRYAGGS